ncbi:response regulator, partial [Myxococcota bacterium]|nr:response regulator [Myxococcota bacterium]
DDNATNRSILLRHLQAWGAQGVECVNGAEALATLRRSQSQGIPFHIGIFDFAMPGMDGLSLCEAIESDASLGRLPVVMLTSMDVSTENDPRRPNSIAARLSKPCRRAHLHRALVAASGHRTEPVISVETGEPEKTPQLSLEILLVEDNLVNQRVGVAMLTRLGCRVHVASSGQEALQQAGSTSPDLILMDCELPDFDGLEVTRRIRAREAAEGADPVSILALTAHATEAQRLECLAAGMNGFLTKPVTFDALTGHLETQLRKRTVDSTLSMNSIGE